MIVVCTSCSARFRVADEKIGPRGVRIRCSKCQNVFEARWPASGSETPRPAPSPQPSPAFEVDLDDSGRGRGEKPAIPPFEMPDPFASEANPFAVPAAATPLAAAATENGRTASAPDADPFAQPPAVPPTSPADDPFAEAGLSLVEGPPPLAGDPFAAPGAPPEGTAQLPASLSDLAFPDLLAAPEPPSIPPPLPKREPAAAAGEQKPVLADLPEPPAETAKGPPAGPPGDAPRVAEEQPASALVQRQGRLRTLLVNSLSIAVLLALALGLFMFWRGEGREPGLLRAGSLAGGSGKGAVAAQVTSGFYQALDGRLLLFVRGRIRVEEPPPLGAVRVRADIMKGKTVVATAGCTAGALPSPEEIAGITGPADAKRLRDLLARRAPKHVRAGELLPFLVVFTEYPSDLEAATIRVAAEAAAAAGPG